MPHSNSGDRLSAVDALFLYLERKETPINIGCTSIFDGPIPFKSFVRFVESKLPMIPRYHQRVVTPPFNLAHPTWEYDPHFDIREHVHHVVLPHGSETDLRELAGQVFTRLMDREKPLWDLTLVEGLKDGRSAVIARVHHCMVDGVAGVALMNILLDSTPEMPALPRRKPFKAPPLPDTQTSLINAVVSSCSDLLDRMASLQASALNLAQEAVLEGIGTLDQMLRVVPELLKPVERLPFNQPCLAARKVAWTEIPLPEILAIRENRGATVNDIALALVTTALRRYAELHGMSLKDRELRIFVPVNLRGHEEKQNGFGNRISIMPVSIPMDVLDPLKLLDTVHQRTSALKHARIADLIYMAGTCLGLAPTPLQALAGPLSPLVTFPVFNIVCTNVRGPQNPLYLLGRKMLTYHPYVPIGNDWGIGCAVQSYDRRLFFGLTADAVAASDIDRVTRFLNSAFLELHKAAVPVRRTRSRKAAPKPRSSAGEVPRPAYRPPDDRQVISADSHK